MDPNYIFISIYIYNMCMCCIFLMNWPLYNHVMIFASCHFPLWPCGLRHSLSCVALGQEWCRSCHTASVTLSVSSKHTFIHSNYVPELIHWKPRVLQKLFFMGDCLRLFKCFSMAPRPWSRGHRLLQTPQLGLRSECLLPETWVNKTCLVPWHIVLDPSFYSSTFVSEWILYFCCWGGGHGERYFIQPHCWHCHKHFVEWKWQPTPVFLPGASHGQSLVGYSPWGRKELDMTEQLKKIEYLSW